MQVSLELPEDVSTRLSQYAHEHQQTVEEVITDLVRELPLPATSEAAGEAVDDPFAEFYGKYTADVTDITLRHDYYIGEAAMETHEHEHE